MPTRCIIPPHYNFHQQYMDPSTSPQAGSSSSSTLQRGKACLNCRRRKMKCDGVRPVCGPCSRANRPDDCEYTDGQGRTRTQMLEDTIAQLEARIEELENPSSNPGSVMLHDPRSAFFQTKQSPLLGPSQPSTSVLLSRAELSPSSPSSSPPRRGATGLTTQSSTSTAWLLSEEPPTHIVQEILDVFLQYAPSPNFFLHPTRFRHSITLPPGNPGRPIPALVNAVCLWGILFSQNKELLPHETVLAPRIAAQLGHAIPTTPSHRTLQVIQTKLLLVDYFFRVGNFLAGRHEAYSAMSLATACGLHKIRTAQPTPAFTSFIDQIDLSLQEPRDQIEEGERINAFWAVFFVDRCSAVAFGPPLVVSEMDVSGMQIDTPWPLEMETYERGQIYPNLRTTGTVRSFFSGMNNGWPWDNHNPLTQLSKAVALFERASRLAAAWRPGALPLLINVQSTNGLEEIPNVDSYYSDFVAVDQRIDEFKSRLTPIERVALCLSNGATIQLHATFCLQNTASRAKCLSAALAIVRASQAAPAHERVYTSPILGPLWAACGRVIINEIVARRSFHAELTLSPQQHDGDLRNALEQIQSIMAAAASHCALMNYHLSRLQQESAGI
ncbi:hypothetical protein EDB92DRAFT_399742 [Lactarius akahatsu]|uniref:Zn(2)-C6 fungal-type domain-containing protein n=1 Tax=Lactarius akahatsu TaxID=416441 RepID=A0AAD4LHU0_9AGAM|nr:hypothetical protein EDB92DRAFT_399742 [Lactarius akahatsu]